VSVIIWSLNIGCEVSLNRIQNKIFLRRFSPDGRYLVGISGGRDSVVLLHLLVASGYKKMIVCHLNHQLRGRASATDVRFVEQIATKHHLDLEIASANVRELATKKKISIEAAAREARYQFFARMAKHRHCSVI